MTMMRKDRRGFLRGLACLAASGGAGALIPQLRMLGTALAQGTSFSDYKALVCVYLAGGNDAFNLLVPTDSTRYNAYVASRSGIYDPNTNPDGLALANAQLLSLTGAGGSGSNNYGLHPAMPELRDLYDAQKLAFAVNVGTLLRPISKTEYNASAANRPAQLFSHSDQENLWHVGTAQDNTLGWCGTTIDALKPQFPPGNNTQLSPCISIAGANKVEIGSTVFPYQLSSSGLTSLSGLCNDAACGTGNTSRRDAAFNALLADSYAGNLAAGEYAKIFQRGRDLYTLLNTGFAGSTISTPFPVNNDLGDQLLTVARMIKLSRAQSYAARQIYYVRLGGFDLHDNQMTAGNADHAALLALVSQALGAFWNALGEIGARNEVTTFTMSEFGRTLSSNGNGSDHGWGSIQFALGGAVLGGKLYADGGGVFTQFPDLSLDNAGNLSRGQFIPGIGLEQYAATLARWMGVDSTGLGTIFPNLHDFNTSYLGFLG